MGSLNAWYAIVATPAYFLGGIVADKFYTEDHADLFLYIHRSAGTVVLSMFPGYNASRIIFAVMGFTTVMTLLEFGDQGSADAGGLR